MSSLERALIQYDWYMGMNRGKVMWRQREETAMHKPRGEVWTTSLIQSPLKN